MEKNVAILMADLSGYSALTETHGAVSAADLIDKYISIAENCLVGDCRLHQQTGDEIMFVSDSSDVMLSTALKLAAHTASEEHFLQVHGGLHYGKVLKRGGNYFGFAVNLAARIAAKATAGTFCCSAEFIDSVSDKSVCRFQSQGNYLLKNISAEKELFELSVEKIKTNYIDPVCRMLILHPEKAIGHPTEDQLYFCSPQCLAVYNKTQKFGQTM
ncbi:MAG: adenylate/guanylate cyclase domain-containing protein [Bacteroidota bacterium]